MNKDIHTKITLQLLTKTKKIITLYENNLTATIKLALLIYQ